MKEFGVNYVSSPEVGFLKSLGGKLRKSNVKLILRFLDEKLIEPSTKQTYGAILKDLKSVKTFASGILAPKNYIWPVNKDQYLQPATTLVKDAHALGLEVYAFKFANDFISSYNYSYDPSAEYLQFIDNSDFSVDGVLTDFPSTASAAIGKDHYMSGKAKLMFTSRIVQLLLHCLRVVMLDRQFFLIYDTQLSCVFERQDNSCNLT